MPQVVAVISSSPNEAAERTAGNMRKTRGREIEKRRSLYTHCVIYQSQEQIYCPLENHCEVVYIYASVCWAGDKKRNSRQRGEFPTAYLQLLNQHVSSKTTGFLSYCRMSADMKSQKSQVFVVVLVLFLLLFSQVRKKMNKCSVLR